MNKQYVMICGPERVVSMGGNIRRYEYREKCLGLIHPAILSFYQDLKNNMLAATDGLMTTPVSRIYRAPESVATEWFHSWIPGEFPVLIYDDCMYDKPGAWDVNNSEGYLIVPLFENEFSVFEQQSEDNIVRFLVKRKMGGREGGITIKILRNNPFSRKERSEEYYLEQKIKREYRRLEVFDTLMLDEIYKIPVESTNRTLDDRAVDGDRGY